MNRQEAYSILGLKPGAAEEDVKKAYRNLAFQHHPDRNPGNKESEEKFKKISAAYQEITNPDTVNYEHHHGQQSGSSFINDLFNSDFFGNIFGRQGNRNQHSSNSPGEDHTIVLNLSFKEACLGGDKQIEFTAPEVCNECNGAGGAAEDRITCSDCNGLGVIDRGSNGHVVFRVTCTKCAGRGASFNKLCAKCHGQGKMRVDKSCNVHIPPGIQAGMTLRLAGMGGKSLSGGRSGNLFIKINVEPHPTMWREGNDILSIASISLKSALLGCELEVETLHGVYSMKIPPCTKPGQKLAIRDKGIHGNTIGSHIAVCNVEFPESLTQEQQEQLKNIL
jgi:molecular chaperone DnaJ